MSNLTPRIDNLDSQPIKLSFIDVPNTQVQNRAQIQDLANDLSAHAGINRITTSRLFEIQDEIGPNGERVQGVVNDKFDQIRVVGEWVEQIGTDGNSVTLSGAFIVNPNNFIEITFFGTALNLLTRQRTSTSVMDLEVDGSPAGTFDFGGSQVLNGRTYNPNQVINVVSGLSLGIHTVLLRGKVGSTETILIQGLEIINESSTLTVNPGTLGNGKTLAQHQSIFNASFDVETGTDVGVGGAVSLYEEDAVIKKAVNWAEDNQLNLVAADHSNEEIIGRHNFREFGAGRSDDFSTLASGTSDRAFTLDDGSTTLVGNDVTKFTAIDALSLVSTGSFLTLTFIGTGVDISFPRADGTTMDRPLDIFLDDIQIANDLLPRSLADVPIIFKIASGLPYGTHTLKIERTAIGAAGLEVFKDFIVYGPKKPTLPVGAVPLHSYNLMADFVANTTPSIDTIATGVLRKTNLRELVLVEGSGGTGDWVFSFNVLEALSGSQLSTDRTGTFEYTFFGTGFEHRFKGQTNNSSSVSVTVDGLALTTANFSGTSFSVYGDGGLSYNSGTGILDSSTSGSPFGSGFRASGLSLGLHTVKFTNDNAGQFLRVNSLDIITPIHTPKQNGSVVVQDILRVGSQGVADLRRFTDDDAGYNEMTQVSAFATTSTTDVPTAINTTVKVTKKGRYHIHFSGQLGGGNNATQFWTFYVNGAVYGTPVRFDTGAGTTERGLSFHENITLAPGTYTIKLFARANNSVNTTMTLGRLTVNRIGN